MKKRAAHNAASRAGAVASAVGARTAANVATTKASTIETTTGSMLTNSGSIPKMICPNCGWYPLEVPCVNCGATPHAESDLEHGANG